EWLSEDNHDAFLLFMDRYGKWRVNTVINGFTQKLGALCSSFSTTDDIVLIGKDKADMRVAFERMRTIGGGIVLAHEGEIDRKSTRLNYSHVSISYAVFCLKK